jgi:hypothetical protein
MHWILCSHNRRQMFLLWRVQCSLFTALLPDSDVTIPVSKDCRAEERVTDSTRVHGEFKLFGNAPEIKTQPSTDTKASNTPFSFARVPFLKTPANGKTAMHEVMILMGKMWLLTTNNLTRRNMYTKRTAATTAFLAEGRHGDRTIRATTSSENCEKYCRSTHGTARYLRNLWAAATCGLLCIIVRAWAKATAKERGTYTAKNKCYH